VRHPEVSGYCSRIFPFAPSVRPAEKPEKSGSFRALAKKVRPKSLVERVIEKMLVTGFKLGGYPAFAGTWSKAICQLKPGEKLI